MTAPSDAHSHSGSPHMSRSLPNLLTREKSGSRPMTLPAASFKDTIKQLATLLDSTHSAENEAAHYELTKEFLVCYKRFAPPARLFHLLKTLIAKNRHVRGTLRLLYFWIDSYFAKDFWRPGSRRIGRLLALLALATTKGQEALDEVNRVKLVIIRKYRDVTSHGSVQLREIDVLKNIATGKDRAIERFFDFNPRDIAEQLTLLEYNIFRSIEPEEFYDKGWTKEKKAPNLHNLVARADQVSYWVASNILCQKSASTQLRAVNRFVLIAQWCEQMGNYNSLMEILGGFHLWAVSRLKRSWNLEKKYQILLRHLEAMMSPNANYANYRKILAKRAAALEAGVPTLPYLGLFLKDLTFIEDGNADMIDDKRLNFDKIAMIGNTLRSIQAYQNVDYNKKIKGKITSLLKHLANVPRLSEDELNRISETLKPMKTLDDGSKISLANISPTSSSDSVTSLNDASSEEDPVPGDAGSVDNDSSDASDMVELSVSDHSRTQEILKYIPNA